ncbi:MmcQ/YjbR family DNA-binding protein [Streptococcus ferus]|uniref:MmcQ/YjbR family DNA-binding protein n=1 Tax=Streptococcus ferus TaxID=1345 RepID=UPI0035A0F5C6
MSIESDFFKGRRVLFDNLLPFGFVKEGQDFYYHHLLMDGMFEAHIRISQDGQLSGRVLDLDMGEDYIGLRVEQQRGSFASQVREAYLAILGHISDHCFEAQPFLKEQTNRLARYLEKTYGDGYDHPFAKSNASAYRNPSNQKWYALVMTIVRQKLDLGQEDWSEEALAEEIEVINLKVNPAELPALLQLPSVYPAYHMGKKSWVSIVMGEELSDDLLFDLVDKSRVLAGGGLLSESHGSDYWLIPANLAYYDIDAEFAAQSIIDWTQKASIKAGDYVFIYITAPTRALRYACKVLEAGIDNKGQRDHPNIKKLMRIQLLKTFDDSRFDRQCLLKHSLKTVRGPRRMPKSLIEEVKKELED